MNVISSAEGIALIQIKLSLPDGSTVDFLSGNIQLDSAAIIDRVDGYCEYVYNLRAPTDQYVNDYLKSIFGSGDPEIQVRLGVGSPGGVVDWIPWQTHTVVSYNASLYGQTGNTGYITKMVSRDRLWSICRYNRIAVRKGTISNIVESIASAYSFQTVIEKTGGSSVPLTFVQSNMSDDEFIRTRMVNRAVNSNGRGGYRLFVRDNALHFHTIDYKANTLNIAYVSGEALNLVHVDCSQELIKHGSAGVRYITHDPYSGDTTEFVSDPSSALKLATSTPQVTKAIGVQTTIPWHVGVNGPDEIKAMANSSYDRVKNKQFGLMIKVPNCINTRAGDFVNISITNDGSNSPWAGLYYVGMTKRVYVQSALMTSIYLYRGDYEDSKSDFSQLASLDKNAVSQSNAEGQRPNLNSSTSGTSANDPNSAL